MSIAIFVLNSDEFQPIGLAARAAGMAAASCGDYSRYTSEQDDVFLRRDEATIRPALWFGCLTGGCDGEIVTFDDSVLHLRAVRDEVGR
jgi:hypothetical protein